MPARSTFATACTGLALLLTLAGCQKPSAGATLVSDGNTVHVQASQYCRSGKVLTQGNECPGTGPAVTVFKVGQGNQVGVDVDKVVANHGWYLYDADAKTAYAVQNTHYTTFIADYTNRPAVGIINLQIREVDHQPTSDKDHPKIIGLWAITLQQKG